MNGSSTATAATAPYGSQASGIAEHAGAHTVSSITQELEEKGIVVLPELVKGEQLRGMQEAFASRLRRIRWNNVDGFEKTERYRHMVQDVLTLDQGFVDVALHPLVKGAIAAYIGTPFELCEAKGWLTLPTRDFHSWHGDAWYDQTKVSHIPREVKLAVYLTDVKSGAFAYLLGTHRRQAPKNFDERDLTAEDLAHRVDALGKAGTAILFDTSGIHRQSVPVLESRHAIFYNYHDPSVPLQAEDVAYYRYHPLLLNAAFLGGLAEEDYRILGFGSKTNYIANYERRGSYPKLERFYRSIFEVSMRGSDFTGRVSARLRRMLG
ncbi:MAG: phytanoyl-CoA dioxygenase family protein [Gemmatimonadaceae bacterium]